MSNSGGTWVASCGGVVSACGVGGDGATAEWKHFPPPSPHVFPPASFHCSWAGQLLKSVFCPVALGEENIAGKPGIWIEKQLLLDVCCGHGDIEGAEVSADPSEPEILPKFPHFAFFSLPWKDGKIDLRWLIPCKLHFMMGTPCFASAIASFGFCNQHLT